MTLGKLYTESEITVMHACGLSKAVLVKAAMILAVFTAIVAAVNVMWAGPWSSRHQDEVLAEAKANPGMAALAQGQFQQATNGSSVLFIESVDGSDFKDVFLAQIRPKGNARPSVVVADSGHLTQLRDGSQVVTLNQGKMCIRDSSRGNHLVIREQVVPFLLACYLLWWFIFSVFLVLQVNTLRSVYSCLLS